MAITTQTTAPTSKPGNVPAQYTPKPGLISTKTCLMRETVVDCGISALTSPCPPGNGDTTKSRMSSTSLAVPLSLATSAAYESASHSVGAGVVVAIVIGSIVGLVVLVLIGFSPCRTRGDGSQRHGTAGGTARMLSKPRRHAPKPSVSAFGPSSKPYNPSDRMLPPMTRVPPPVALRPVILTRPRAQSLNSFVPNGGIPPGARPRSPNESFVTVERPSLQKNAAPRAIAQ